MGQERSENGRRGERLKKEIRNDGDQGGSAGRTGDIIASIPRRIKEGSSFQEGVSAKRSECGSEMIETNEG